jgi:hypothetical protein
MSWISTSVESLLRFRIHRISAFVDYGGILGIAATPLLPRYETHP